jgi:ABC-type arginine/histidine transport system permease subunit
VIADVSHKRNLPIPIAFFAGNEVVFVVEGSALAFAVRASYWLILELLEALTFNVTAELCVAYQVFELAGCVYRIVCGDFVVPREANGLFVGWHKNKG